MKNSVATLGIAFMFALPHAAQAQSVTPPPVPANIEVPAGDEAFLVGHAFGTQNYECQPVRSLGRVGWCRVFIIAPPGLFFEVRVRDRPHGTYLIPPSPIGAMMSWTPRRMPGMTAKLLIIKAGPQRGRITLKHGG